MLQDSQIVRLDAPVGMTDFVGGTLRHCQSVACPDIDFAAQTIISAGTKASGHSPARRQCSTLRR